MLQILYRIFSEDLELNEAVNQVNEILVPELMPYPANLEYYSEVEI